MTGTLELRERSWPADDDSLFDVAISFLEWICATAVNKLVGLTEEQARSTPLRSSPAMSLLGLVKHLTAVQREHVQRRIGGSDLPSLWRSDDTAFEFRVRPDETIATIVAAFDEELSRTRRTMAGVDPEGYLTEEGPPKRIGRVFIDVVQESARHLGHMDILREMIDGGTGE